MTTLAKASPRTPQTPPRQLQTQITEADGAPFGNPLGLASRDTFLRAGASA